MTTDQASISLTTPVAVDANVVHCELAGAAALLDMRSGTYFGLNGIGSKVWSLLSAPTTADAISAALVREYDVDAERCRNDVVALLQQLANAQLIKVGDAGPAEVS